MVTQKKIYDLTTNATAAQMAASQDHSAQQRAKSLGLLDSVADVRVLNGTINRRTALFVDMSGCRRHSVPVGRRIASVLAALATSTIHTYAFDSLAYPLEAPNVAPASWTDAIAGLSGGESTAIGAPLEAMRMKAQIVEQIAIVTDGRENSRPRFVDVFHGYRMQLGVRPSVVVIRVGDYSHAFEHTLRENDVEVRGVAFDGPGSLSRLVQTLSRPSRLDTLVDRVGGPAW